MFISKFNFKIVWFELFHNIVLIRECSLELLKIQFRDVTHRKYSIKDKVMLRNS